MRRLIVTEKNNTAKRIANILSGGKEKGRRVAGSNVYTFSEDDADRDTTVMGLRGHIIDVDFPADKKNWNAVGPEELVWTDIVKKPTEKKYANALKKLGGDAEEVTIATDYDREGELIGVEALEIISSVNKEAKFDRARYSAITNDEIEKSFSNLVDIDFNLAQSADARRVIDLVWGASLTRFLSLSSMRLGNNFLSVGRVQTPTLALITEKEEEIDNFVPEPYWELYLKCVRIKDSHTRKSEISECLKDDFTFIAKHKKGRFHAKKEVDRVKSSLGDKGEVKTFKKRIKNDMPPNPFNTTAFLKAATSIGFTASNAMRTAENLYSQGLLSYPRTDNAVYSKIDLKKILGLLSKMKEFSTYSKKLLGKELKPTRGKEAKDHPPIHPVGYTKREKLNDEEWKIYELVVRRFLATLSDAAKIEGTKAEIDVNGELFNATGSKIIEKGWREIYPYSSVEEVFIPELSVGEILKVESFVEEKETKPPRRYGQGRLIEKMDELGLGTKSTRHEMISKLYGRGYVHGNPLKPTIVARAVIKTLDEYAEKITDVKMTKELEEEMDTIAEGRLSDEEVIKRSREMLGDTFEILKKNEEKISKDLRERLREEKVVGKCEKCGGDLIIRRTRRGTRFIGCSSYPDCDFSLPLPKSGRLVITDQECKEHGLKLIKILYKKKTWDLGCPYCNYIEWMAKKKEEEH